MAVHDVARLDHVFRVASPSAREIRQVQRTFTQQAREEHRTWLEDRRHRNIIAESLARRFFGDHEPDPRVKESLHALRDQLVRPTPVRDMPLAGPPVFEMKPGLNVLAPPYDFGLNVALGSNTPAVIISLASGTFQVNGTAPAGKNTYGSAGIGLFIVPSEPSRTLSIRPYFQYEYRYLCESHGPPTAHCRGVISASASGRTTGGTSVALGTKTQWLWSAGSDAWDDAHGYGGDCFRIPDSELVVSGFDFYTITYACQGSADANETLWWWSTAEFQLWCRVPFLVVEEF